MKISGFSYVRNGFDYSVPFIEAILSVLPICDEFVIAVGDSTDGTREAIEALKNDKIRILDTKWDMNLRKGGKIFAQQTNLALDQITGDWAFHIQADEVIHENSLPIILEQMKRYQNDDTIDGFIFPFIHFWGDYYHIRNSRRVHKHEIRLFKNNKLVRSYRDSQGFRIYNSLEGYESGTEKGTKLNVKKVDTPVFHYNGVRTPQELFRKAKSFNFFYDPEEINPAEISTEQSEDLQKVDRVTEFKGTHPKVMKSRVESFTFKFVHDTKKAKWKFKDRLAQPIEDWLGFKFGEYKNYKLIK